MNLERLSLFFDDRWEQDRIQHFYFLKTPAYRKISNLAKHVVVKGHRGTGKTTLMRALDWRERLTNTHLQSMLGADAFADGVIGCFLQIKMLPVGMLDIWLRNSSDQVRYLVIASYLRATWIQELVVAIRGLRSRRRFANYGDEIEDLRTAAKSTWRWAPEKLQVSPPLSSDIITLDDLEDIAVALMRRIRNAAAIEIPTPEQIVADLDLAEFAHTCAATFDALLVHARRMNPDRAWMFRVCMDEGEFLSEDWAVTLRTLIRETDAPVYIAVSVLVSLGNSTRAIGASLSIDDREIIDLDNRPAEQMIALLNGIISARLSLVGMSPAKIDLRSFLGTPDIEDLLRMSLSTSETRPAKSLLERMNREPNFAPIRDHLVQQKAIRETPNRVRRDESSGYRKKKVAGYLHLLGTIGVERPTYAGWRIAVNMADNSVRDFIRFMRYAMEAWLERSTNGVTETELADFLGQKCVDFEIQDKALARLGGEKFQSMSATLAAPGVTTAIVRLFGEISHRADFHSLGAFTKPNANRMLVRMPPLESGNGLKFAGLADILHDAASYGYISDLQIGEDFLKCRVNRSFARVLGFSYWRPQYDTPVPFHLISNAAESPDAPPVRWLGPARQPSPPDREPIGELEGWT